MEKEKFEDYLLKTELSYRGVGDYQLELNGKISTLILCVSFGYTYIESEEIEFDITSFNLDNAETIKELLDEDIDRFNSAYENLAKFLKENR